MKTIQYMLLIVAGLMINNHRLTAQRYLVESPDKQLQVQITPGSNEVSLIDFQLRTRSKIELIGGSVGIRTLATAVNHDTANQKSEDKNYLAAPPDKRQVSRSWTTVYGERRIVPENYRELEFRFAKNEQEGDSIVVTCRLYNEGFAYRYQVVRKKPFILQAETSSFKTMPGSVGWVSRFAQSAITSVPIHQLADTVERPLTIQLSNGKYLALGEAALTDFSRMKFGGRKTQSLGCVLNGPVASGPRLLSPWRYILTGNSPAALLNHNYMIENLNPPSAISNTDWIKPGKILREVTLSTTGALNCIDFASRHDISYICFDAGWYGKEDSDTSDATRVSLDPARAKGSLDLQKVIDFVLPSQISGIRF
ncbi:MAG: hypothetical protein EOO68_01170 [Moraxellaceae bacterium]|nr:MAG: hypothetical protein EOO68_01170 [Moraxellaceae bacterium]